MTLTIHGKYRRLIEGKNIKFKKNNKKSSNTKNTPQIKSLNMKIR